MTSPQTARDVETITVALRRLQESSDTLGKDFTKKVLDKVQATRQLISQAFRIGDNQAKLCEEAVELIDTADLMMEIAGLLDNAMITPFQHSENGDVRAERVHVVTDACVAAVEVKNALDVIRSFAEGCQVWKAKHEKSSDVGDV